MNNQHAIGHTDNKSQGHHGTKICVGLMFVRFPLYTNGLFDR